jgi:hypothetical protein
LKKVRLRLRKILSGCVLAAAGVCIVCCGSIKLTIKSNESVIFYPTVASYDKKTETWNVPVHAHVFELEQDSFFRNQIIASLKKDFDIKDAEKSVFFERRMRNFMVDNQGWKRLNIRIGDEYFSLENTAMNGHVEQTVKIADSVMKVMLKKRNLKNRIPVEAVLAKEDARKFSGYIYLTPEKPVFVVSDIDDTIKVSDVRNKSALVKNTFISKFEEVKGMPELYQNFAKKGAVLYYVSASPWQLYPEFNDFFSRAAFPEGAFCLKYVRLKDTDFFNLFVKGYEYKIKSIEPLFSRFPGAKFILIGDSGEMDPEAYGYLAAKYPDSIGRIIIRNAYNQEEPARYEKAFKGVPKTKWQIIKDPAEVKADLSDL